MNRVLIGAVGGFACLGIAACGSAAAGGTRSIGRDDA